MLYAEKKEIDIEIKAPPKMATIRHPTPDEWLERMRQQKTVRRELGRGASTTKAVKNMAADLELLNAITIKWDSSDTGWTEREAHMIIGKMSTATVEESDLESHTVKVTLRWRFWGDMDGDTVHVLKIPTLDQVQQYQDEIVRYKDRRRLTEIQIQPRVAMDLYTELVESATGYAEDMVVPPHHMVAVVGEVVGLIGDFGSDPIK